MTSYADAIVFESLVKIFIVVIVFVFLIWLFGGTNTKRYRRSLVDLYVSAKIRFLAKKDDLDLEKELENFKLWEKSKKKERDEYRLDNAIEDELKEKISEDTKKE